MDIYQQFIHKSKYARWIPSLKRRETWPETVQRYIDFFVEERGEQFSSVLNDVVKPAILKLDVMPSMRALMTAGEALRRDNIAGYNCAYVAVNNKRVFSEALHILMCGTGVGFSCERQEIGKLPSIPETLTPTGDTFVVADSKEGWAKAYSKLISALYMGDIPNLDYSQIRPAGARLRTFGGRASGPEPLVKLVNFTVGVFKAAAGRKLTSIEVHDIMCVIGEVVVVGGVRRSALISLSNLDDKRLGSAKSNFNVDQYAMINETDSEWVYTLTMKRNQPVHPTYRVVLRKSDQGWVRNLLELTKVIPWYIVEPQRGLANNSVAYSEKPDSELFLTEWLALMKSKSGERGIFNREAAKKQALKYGRRSADHAYGCNPCSEIILRDKQFCNLSEIVIRADDTKDTIMEKARIATIIGTFQATLIDFKFLSDDWTKNTVDEALLGVSMTGIMDNSFMAGLQSKKELAVFLDELRVHCVEANRWWAEILGIKPAAAITCVKPSGTVSQLVDAASGIHARHNHQYVRTVRMDKKDPIYKFMMVSGFSIEDDATRPDSTAVASFPIKAPRGAVVRSDMTAIEQLELWLLYQRHWCEHKPSVTISVGEDEWIEVGAWVYKNFDEVSGISFLPRTEHTYVQAPYQDKTEDEFEVWVATNPVPEIDWSKLAEFESDDETTGAQQLACVAGICEL